MIFSFKNHTLDFSSSKIFIMGILNVTPDSFSDGGKYINKDKALFQVEKMINEGADIIDIGGESTRPFSNPVLLEQELARVIPIIELINKNFNTIVSIDTYKSEVADLALQNGAQIINDISGFTFDSDMINIASKHNATCIVMHLKGTPRNMQVNPVYNDVVKEIYDFLEKQVNLLRQNGIKQVIIDLGFGFGKTLDDNYTLLASHRKFANLQCPMLAGISRKSMIGKVVETKPIERIPGTIALNTIAVLNGVKIIRVHDVKENFQAMKVVEKYCDINPIKILQP